MDGALFFTANIATRFRYAAPVPARVAYFAIVGQALRRALSLRLSWCGGLGLGQAFEPAQHVHKALADSTCLVKMSGSPG